MGFESGFKMGSDLIDKIGQRRESRERTKSMRSSRKLTKQEIAKEKRRQQYGAGDLPLRLDQFPDTTEGRAAFKVAKRNKPLSGLEVSESLSGKKKSKADAIKSKADAMTAKVDAQMAKRTENLTSDRDIGEQIELGLLQKRATANKTTAETAEIEANTEKLNLINGSFLDQQETDNLLRAEEARARLNESKARLKAIRESSKKYKDAKQHVKDNAETQAQVTTLISEAGNLLANPNSRALAYDVMSELEEEINSLPRDTLSQQTAFLGYRQQFEKFREETDTKNRYAQSRQRQTNDAIGKAAMSDAQMTQHSSLIKQGRHREAAEMVGMRAFAKYVIKNEVPVRVLIDPNESKQFLKYDQDPDNKWHTMETTKPDGTIVKEYVKDKDGAPIPNMVLNVEDSRDLLEEYVREYKDKYPTGVRGTMRTTTSPKRASTDPLADLGNQPAADGALETEVTHGMTITGLGSGQAQLFAQDGHPNLSQRLLDASTPDDIDNMMKAITDPQADLWALMGDDSDKFRTEGIEAMGEQGTLSPEEQATAKKNIQEFEEKKANVLREALRRQEARRDKYKEGDHAKEGTKATDPTDPELSVPPRTEDAPTPKDIPPRDDLVLGTDVLENKDGTITVKYGGIPLVEAEEFGKKYFDITGIKPYGSGEDKMIGRLMSGDVVGIFEDNIRPLGAEHVEILKKWRVVKADIVLYTKKAETPPFPMAASDKKSELLNKLKEIEARSEVVVSLLTTLNEGRAEAYRLQKLYSGKGNPKGRKGGDVNMTREEAKRRGIIK